MGRPPPRETFYDFNFAVEEWFLDRGVRAWFQRHGRRVINDGRALQFEISKVAQYAALTFARCSDSGETVAAVGRAAIRRGVAGV